MTHLGLRSLALSAAVIALVGTTPTAAALSTAPSAPVSQSTRAESVQVNVENPTGTIKPNDERFLIQETQKIDFPPSVKSVTYLVIDGRSDNLNDDVVQWIGTNRPDLVPDGTDKGGTWKLGELIVAVSTEQRHNGIYCGNDVCSDLKLTPGDGHLQRSLDDMKPSLRDQKWAAGLLEGTKAAADPSLEPETSDVDPRVVGGIGGGVAVVGGGIAIGAYATSRKKKIATAKEQFSHISATYGDTAQRLDQIDIRANSLASPLAHAELRSQWATIRDDFLQVHDQVDRLGLTLDSQDKDFYAKRKDIATAHASVSALENADQNINTLFEMERGDEVVRRRELAALREDVSEALNDKTLSNKTLGRHQLDNVVAELKEVDGELRALEGTTAAPDFMDRFALALRKHGHAMDQLSKQMKNLKLSEHSTPNIGDSTWRPGYGYHGWYPYLLLSTWHSSDTAAASSSGSSGVNTSFRSGFSGGGGSSSF